MGDPALPPGPLTGPSGSALGLRIDVDFAVGLDEAVPRMLAGLARAGLRATFFIVAGRNRPCGSLRRLARPGYLRRLLRLGPAAIAARLGSSLAGDGSFLQSRSHCRVLRRIVDEGHELAVHGHDHAWWADHAWTASEQRLEAEIDLAFATIRETTGLEAAAWGSPSWRTTEAVLRALHRRGVPYFADCWGREPFVTLDEGGSEIPVPHLPVTLPSLERLLLVDGLGPGQAVERVLDGERQGHGDVLCMHDYFEGLLKPELFEAFVRGCERRGLRVLPLRETARRLESSIDRLPRCRLVRGPLPAFVGEVSWQAPAL